MNTPLIDNDLASIRQELNELRAEMAALRKNGHGNHSSFDVLTEPALTDRRGMMKKMAGLAVGVAAVGLLKPSNGRAATRGNPQISGKGLPDADGGNFILGQSNSATSNTFLNEGSPSSSFIVQNASTTVLNNAPLTGRNYASSAPALPTELVGVFGATHAVGSTTPDADIAGVYGSAVTTGNGFATGVIGAGTDFGVVGNGSIGVQGNGSGSGCGVDASVNSAATNAYGVNASASSGAGGAFTGGRAAIILFQGSGAVADPNVAIPTGSGSGDLYRGSANSGLWYNAGGTNPYRRVADSTTAGALTAFPSSSRFVNLNTVNGGATATYQIGGVTVTGNTVPTKARAIIARIADANPSGTGNLLVGAANPPVGGVIAITPGAPQNSFFFSALDATGKLYVKNTSASGSVQVIIDVLGYYE